MFANVSYTNGKRFADRVEDVGEHFSHEPRTTRSLTTLYRIEHVPESHSKLNRFQTGTPKISKTKGIKLKLALRVMYSKSELHTFSMLVLLL